MTGGRSARSVGGSVPGFLQLLDDLVPIDRLDGFDRVEPDKRGSRFVRRIAWLQVEVPAVGQLLRIGTVS
jgi:hypothetical protein